MDFSLTVEQQDQVDAAAAFAAELAPDYQNRERTGVIEKDVFLEMGRRGFIGPEISPELGGRGQTCLTSGLLLEQISKGDFNVGYLQVVGSLVGQILAGNARPEVAREWVPQITGGTGVVGIGLSEPTGGSDAGNPGMRAEQDGGDWLITGAKSMSLMEYCTGAVVFARTSDEGRGRGITAFVVDVTGPGITREPYSDMGTKPVRRGAIHFDRVRVPARNVLGEVGRGFTSVMQGFDFSRALIGLQCVGTAQQTVDETWQYVAGREAFDRPISTFQGVSFPLAEADTLLAAARVLCYQTLWLKDTGLPHTSEAAMCKWWAPKTAYDVINQCLLLHGQYGYRTERPIEQRLRDVLGLQIGDGTAQIMKLIIARQKLGRKFAP
ncbi:acyl-CoA dehydrogenase family protein [Nakamurella sp.]|uniref:acyl-CoA dehydrogenase family protein n=1 Tax=Nakamurella sp. TaxID=1869182 RepID=UPI003B3A88F0